MNLRLPGQNIILYNPVPASNQFGRFRLKLTLHFALLSFFACAAIAAFSISAHAQRFDVAGGLSTLDAPGVAYANGVTHQPESLNGTAYLTFSGDFLFYHKTIGVEGEYVRKEGEGSYYLLNNTPYRPMFYDANAIWTKKFFHRFQAELVGGAGFESTRFYTAGCGSGSSCYANKNHFMVDFGAGLKVYPLDMFIVRHIFLRPEGRFYVINNNREFSSNQVIRYGASIGYTF